MQRLRVLAPNIATSDGSDQWDGSMIDQPKPLMVMMPENTHVVVDHGVPGLDMGWRNPGTGRSEHVSVQSREGTGTWDVVHDGVLWGHFGDYETAEAYAMAILGTGRTAWWQSNALNWIEFDALVWPEIVVKADRFEVVAPWVPMDVTCR